MTAHEDRLKDARPLPAIDIALYTQGRSRNVGELYALLGELGYHYGSALRVIRNVWRQQDKWVFELYVRAGEQRGQPSLSPALLDGIFQTVLVKEYLIEGRPPEDNTLHVPHVIKSFKTFAALTDRCYVVLVGQDISRKGGDLSAQLRAYNGSGECSLQIDDMIFKKVPRQFLDMSQNRMPYLPYPVSGAPEKDSFFFYQPQWIEQQLAGPRRELSRRHAIVFLDGASEAAELYAAVLRTYRRSFPVRRKNGRPGGEEGFEIEAGVKRDYEELLLKISSAGNDEVEGYDIFYFWAYTPGEHSPLNEETLAGAQENGLKPYFLLLQALRGLPARKAVNIFVATWNTQAVTAQDNGAGCRHGGLFGLSKTAMLEQRGLRIKVVDFSENKQAADRLVEESSSSDDAEWVAYRKDQRYIYSLQPMEGPASGTLPFREGGVYLLPGGLGGLGFKIAELISQRVKARLILLGRSPLSPEQQQRIAGLRMSGSVVIYVQADAADPARMKDVLKTIKRDQGPINGVVQMSGILEDKLLVNKDWESFQRVLSPKVRGTWTINHLTRKEPLDFFAIFSSIVSVIGNPGQADYAAANSFLDAFIHYRARNKYPGKSLGINWTLWSDGGMGKERSIEEAFSRRAGVIDSSAGLQAFTRLLGGAYPQVIVAGRPDLPAPTASEHKNSGNEGNDKNDKAVRGDTAGTLLDLLAKITQIPSSDLDTDTDLRDFGLDSIALAEYADRISEQFGIAVEPTLFFEFPTIEALDRQLTEHYGLQPGSPKNQGFFGVEPGSPKNQRFFGVEPAAKAPNSESDTAALSRREPQTDTLTVTSAADQNRPGLEQDIAVIGISGRFPGARTVEEFWKNLLEKRDAISKLPVDRPQMNSADSPWGGFLDEVSAFDAAFFQISPMEAERMDPQQRLLLEEVWRTIEDAGYAPSSLSGSKTGVFIGVCNSDYSELLLQSGLRQDAYISTGSYFSIIPNRISYLLDLHGPSVALDTACSSSLIAVHLAIQALHNGDCTLALAGGVNVCLTGRRYSSFSHAGMLSPDGRCKTFDKSANGYVRGEGVGAILLKPLDRALADNDHIYGVIRATAANHGGRATSLTAPNPNAQSELIISAYERAGIEPWSVGYIEAHGTGTSLGDPVELNGLKNAFAELYRKSGKLMPPQPHCGLGSVKTNIGHLESAAGIAGIIKVLLSMQHATLPATIHVKEINPYIHLEEGPFYIVRDSRPWERQKDEKGRSAPRRAGVSSFGFGGANAHVVLEEYIRPDVQQPVPAITPQTPAIIVLSAKNEDRLKEQARQLLSAIRDRRFTDARLADMAYTLQAGREALDERLAVLAVSLNDLEAKLQKYIEGRNDGEQICHGRVVRNKEALSVFAVDEDLQSAVEKWIAKGKYPRLMELWVKGVIFDWNRLYGETKPVRISLPTYPFAGERYWAPEPGEQKSEDRGQRIHPLLHRNISDLSEQRFSATFTGQEFFLSDHVVKGRKILPGVAYLEMARAAVELAAGGRTEIRLKNVTWVRPLAVEDQPVQVYIGLFPEGDGRISYSIYTHSGDNGGSEPVIHCQGSAELGAGQDIPALDIKTLQAECAGSAISANQYYEELKTAGLEYGPGHQGIEKVYADPTHVSAKLSLPSSVSGAPGQFVLHPGIMDSALQASLMIMSGGLKPAVPFVLQELEVPGECASTMWADIRRGNGSKAGDAVQKCDITLCDDQGTVCVRMKGFTARVLEEETEAVLPPAGIGTLLLEPVWREQRPAPEAPAGVYESRLVMLCEFKGLSAEIIAGRLNGAKCLVMQSGQQGIEERFGTYALQAFEEIQRILAGKPQGAVLVQIAVPHQNGQNEQQLFSGLSGLLKTAELENPKLTGQLIEAGPDEDTEQLVEKLEESGRSPRDKQVRYSDGKRRVAGWSEVSPNKANMPWKDRGVYLITGGGGGLGLLFAGEIAHSVNHATLVLTDLALPGQDTRKRLEEWEALGARTVFRQADVTIREEVDALIQSVRQEYENINGIIHCAGIIRDNFILRKSSEEFRRVLGPKVSGSVYLDEASRDIPLDFFILFSSIAGSLGNIGQADYAAANAFMDAYAQYRNSLVSANRRSGQTLSINWPLWKEGGMRVSEETEKLLMQSMGIVAMRTQTGLQAFAQAVASGKDRLMVMEGDLERIRKKLGGQGTSPARAPLELDAGSLQVKVQAALTKKVSQLLKVKVEDIDPECELNEFGFDSITLTEFANYLNQEYRLELTPAIFFEHTTLNSFSKYLLTECREALAAAFPSPRTAASTAPAVEIKRARFARPLVPQESKADSTAPEPIAVVGMSGRFPLAADVDQFWKNLADGRDCITEIPADRWDWREYYGDPAVEANKTRNKWGGFIDGVDEFDPLFFGISPREAVQMDPQQRLLMTYAWKAIEDAGYSARSLAGTRTAIFVGTRDSGYSGLVSRSDLPIEGYSSTGMVASVGPNRMSYFLDIHGPSEPVETACSSSLIAVHRAVSAMRDGTCDMAIVGGVNTIITPELHISFDKAGMLSADGRCKTFSNKANGYVRGEGVGMLFLKKLGDAERAGDHIYGVIRGAAENHGGRANSLTAPNPKAQADVLKTAYAKAGIDPGTVTYIEAHGTGTELGDPIEINGLKTAFDEMYQAAGENGVRGAHCGLGSVKTNIGHLELAAGIAGMIKVLLQLKHKTLAKSLHCETLNPYIQLNGSPFYIVQETREWTTLNDAQGNKLPRRAGVSSFGFGGANAHVVIEEYIAPGARPALEAAAQNPALIVLSAKNEDRLGEQARLLLSAIQDRQFTDADLAAAAYTLQAGREAMEARLAVTAASTAELREKLKGFVEGRENIEGLYRGQAKQHKEPFTVFAEDEELQDAIGKWIQRNKYSHLLDFWVKGLAVDWDMLYGEDKPGRISLPTYPFARERYWPQKAVSAVPVPETRVLEGPQTSLRYYQSAWERRELLPRAASVLAGPIILFDSSEELHTAFKSRLAAAGARNNPVIMVKAGARYRVLGEHTYELNPAEPGEYRQLIEELARQGAMPRYVIHAWSWGHFIADEETVKAQLEESIYSVFYLSRALMEHKLEGRLRIIYVYPGSNKVQPLYAAVGGFAKTIQLEHSHFVFQTVEAQTLPWDPPAPYPTWVAERVLQEFQEGVPEDPRSLGCEDSGDDAELRYADGHRFVKRLTAFDQKGAVKGGNFLKEQGVYLITGGAGKLGLLVAKHIARTVKAGLVLTDYSVLNDEKEKQIREIESYGSTVLYLKADVSRREEVNALVKDAKDRFGGINGVFHCAGVIRDSLISNKTREELETVLAPKVYGTVWLDEATAEEPLDFFALFSSLAAVTGNAGQSDYAYGNNFMDSFAGLRDYRSTVEQSRPGKTLSINWPLWEDGGMHMDDQAKKLLKETTGLVPLQTPDGLEALETAFASGRSNVIVTAGDQLRISRFLKSEQEEEAAAAACGKDIGAALLTIVAAVTGIPGNKIGADVEFWEIGLDSISSMKVLREIETQFGLRIYSSELQEHDTLGKLTAHVERELRGTAAVTPDAAAPQKVYDFSGTPAAPQKVYDFSGTPAPPVIFLLSTPRAGSTLLRVMLMGHSRIFSPPELHLLPFGTLQERRDYLLDRKQGYLSEGLIESLAELEGVTPEQAISKVKELEDKALSVQETYLLLQNLAKERFVVDKSPSYAEKMEILERAEKTTREPLYIFLVRHPLSVMESFVRNRFDKMLNIKEEPWSYAERLWHDYNRNILHFLSGVPRDRWLQVRYETLVASPETVMKDICSLLNITFEETMVRPYEGKRMTGGLHKESMTIGDPNFLKHDKIDSSFADAWNRGLNKAGLLTPGTIGLALELGYSITGPQQKTDGAYELSFPQRSILNRMGQDPLWGIVHTMEVQLENGFDRDRFVNSVKKVVQKHAVLRRYFLCEGGAWTQYQKETIDNVSVEYDDMTGVDAGARKDRLKEKEKELIDALSTDTPPLLAFAVAAIGDARYVITMVMHMLIADGVTCTLIQQDLFDFYTSGDHSVPAVDARYGDYVAKTMKLAGDPRLNDHLAFWNTHVRDPLLLPNDKNTGPDTVASEKVSLARYSFEDLEISDESVKGKMYHYLSVGLYRFLKTWLKCEDPVVVHRLNRRNIASIGDYPDVVGRFAGDLPLRFSPGSPGTDDIRSFQRLIQAIPLSGLTYELMVGEKRLPAGAAVSPIVLNYQPWDIQPEGPFPVSIRSRQFEAPGHQRSYALDLIVRSDRKQFLVIIKYSENRHSPGTIEMIGKEWFEAVRSVIREDKTD